MLAPLGCLKLCHETNPLPVVMHPATSCNQWKSIAGPRSTFASSKSSRDGSDPSSGWRPLGMEKDACKKIASRGARPYAFFCIITPKTSDFVHVFLSLSCFVSYVDDAKVLSELC